MSYLSQSLVAIENDISALDSRADVLEAEKRGWHPYGGGADPMVYQSAPADTLQEVALPDFADGYDYQIDCLIFADVWARQAAIEYQAPGSATWLRSANYVQVGPRRAGRIVATLLAPTEPQTLHRIDVAGVSGWLDAGVATMISYSSWKGTDIVAFGGETPEPIGAFARTKIKLNAGYMRECTPVGPSGVAAKTEIKLWQRKRG